MNKSKNYLTGIAVSVFVFTCSFFTVSSNALMLGAPVNSDKITCEGLEYGDEKCTSKDRKKCNIYGKKYPSHCYSVKIQINDEPTGLTAIDDDDDADEVEQCLCLPDSKAEKVASKGASYNSAPYRTSSGVIVVSESDLADLMTP